MTKPDYGNWIRLRIIWTFLLIGMGLITLSFLPMPLPVSIVIFALAAFPLGMGVYLFYVYMQFSEQGGHVQEKLWSLVVDRLHWDGRGRALDIGTGNGALAICVAQKYPSSHVTGIDFWGSSWEYGKAVCENNARLEGVAERTTFQKASAASLPFDDGTFDAAVSHFVFHEVADAPDKRDVIREALRVLRPGGVFVFQDMFLNPKLYGSPADLVERVRSWGIAEVALVNTSDAMQIPPLLGTARTLGHAAILMGRK